MEMVKKIKSFFSGDKLSSIQIFICVLFPVTILYCFNPAFSYLSQSTDAHIAWCMVGFSSLYLVTRSVLISWNKKRKDFENIETEGRYTGIDLLRCLAVMMVIILHDLIAIGYYEEPSGTSRFFVLSLLRWWCMSSCPLFMMMSGYLLNKRDMTCSHYTKLFKILRNYFSIVIMFFLIHRGSFSIERLKDFINFDSLWYMNMYFGLFLLVPYLNRLYLSLKKHESTVLIGILLFLSSLWTITDNWTTSYWSALYPILYFFIGRYIRENKIHVRKITAVSVVCLMVFGMSTYSQYINYGASFSWTDNFGGYSSGYNAFPVVVTSTACFLLLYDIRLKSSWVTRIISEISSVSLEIYLISALVTGESVRHFFWSLSLPVGRSWQMLLVAPCELLASFVCGKLINCFWLKAKGVWTSLKSGAQG